MAKLAVTLLLSIAFQGSVLAVTYDMNQSLPELMNKGSVCDDCTQIFQLLVDMLSNADLEKKILDEIERFCAHLPGPTANLCKEEVDKMLPVAITFVTGVAKPSEICKIIGLCNSCDQHQKMLSYFANEALQAAVMKYNENPTTQCSFCIFLFKTLEDLLPKERTEGAVIKLMEEVCLILPASYREQCDSIIGKFGKTVLDAILGYATPEAICGLIHLCKGQEAPDVDPCTLPTFRCRDVKTALKCGTLFYCQKYAWKSPNSNTI